MYPLATFRISTSSEIVSDLYNYLCDILHFYTHFHFSLENNFLVLFFQYFTVILINPSKRRR